jgi:hypothetical protein
MACGRAFTTATSHGRGVRLAAFICLVQIGILPCVDKQDFLAACQLRLASIRSDSPVNPASRSHCSYCDTCAAPAIQPTYAAILDRMALGSSFSASRSLTAILPPVFRRRNISLNTKRFLDCGTRLMTQLLMMQSAVPSASRVEVMSDWTKETLV